MRGTARPSGYGREPRGGSQHHKRAQSEIAPPHPEPPPARRLFVERRPPLTEGPGRCHSVCCRGSACCLERRVVAEDPLLQPLQRRARLDPELLHEHLPCLLVGIERLRLALGAVEGEHQLRAQPFPQRVFTDEHLQLAQHLIVPPERKIAVDPIHQRRQPQLVELCHLLTPVRLEQESGESGAAPERHQQALPLSEPDWKLPRVDARSTLYPVRTSRLPRPARVAAWLVRSNRRHRRPPPSTARSGPTPAVTRQSGCRPAPVGSCRRSSTSCATSRRTAASVSTPS